ncbi:MAG: FHA domain-containing protein [Micrococcus sp.]|nr:FHA domain-containing protein [Micrococcus sp.]
MTPTAMVRYSAGPWLGLVRGRSLVALPADASEETAAVVWDLLAGSPGVEQLLATVLSGRLDLTGMPAFAIVSFQGQEVHAILRGDVHLRMTGLDDGESRLNGTGVSTWNERRVPRVRSFELLVDDALPNAENLPLDAGAVRLAALQADLVGTTSEDAEPCPEVRAAAQVPPAPVPPRPAPESVPAPEAEVGTESATGIDAEVGTESATGIDAEEGTGTASAAGPEAAVEPEPAAGPVTPAEPGPAAGPVTPAGPVAPAEPGLESASESTAEAASSPTPEPEGEPDAADGEGDGDDGVDPAMDEQPDGDSDIGMTIAPDAAEFAAVHLAPDAPQPSGRTTRIQPAGDEGALHDENEPEDEPEDSTIASGPVPADPAPARPASPLPGPQELIDSVPWLAAARRSVPGPERSPAGGSDDRPGLTAGVPADLGQTVAPAAHPDDEADADTVLSPSAVAGAAVAPGPRAGVPVPPPGPAPAVPADPDHDGETVMKSDLDLAGVGTAAPPAPAAPLAPTTGPMVLARQCSDGHANPPTSSTCTVCGQSLGGEARQVRRPALGRIRMSTGEVLELDRPVVIGRQPQAHRVGSGTMPRMIQVRSPNGDISRSHCEVVLEGWHVQLRDLKATNGTVLIREGAAPRRLGQGESVMVLDGDIADLGDGVSLRFEAIP